MDQKSLNYKDFLEKIIQGPAWSHAVFPEFYSDTFHFDFPSAPPGMPTSFDCWEAERCFEWLNRTVKSCTASIEEAYATPGTDLYWVIGTVHLHTDWGNTDGEYFSKYFLQIEIEQNRVSYLKVRMDPLGFLTAAGRKLPIFHMDLYDPMVDQYIPRHVANKTAFADEVLGRTPEAVKKRIRDNLLANTCGIEREKYRAKETCNREYSQGVWFIPDEMNRIIPQRTLQRSDGKDIPEQMKDRVAGWTKASSPWMYRDTRNRIYKTDNDKVYFCEMNGYGPGRWRGNGIDNGHYHQAYLIVIKFDDAGRLAVRDEVLNPISKFNSINVSLPSFPYYL